jgi:hypothetical protein
LQSVCHAKFSASAFYWNLVASNEYFIYDLVTERETVASSRDEEEEESLFEKIDIEQVRKLME